MPEKRFLTLYIGSHVICVLGAAAVLFSCLSMVTAAQLCGGFALVSALEAYGQLKDRAEQRVLLEPVSPQSYFNLRERIGKVNAFTSYEALSSCIMVALEITLVLMYTFLSVTGEQLVDVHAAVRGVHAAGAGGGGFCASQTGAPPALRSDGDDADRSVPVDV